MRLKRLARTRFDDRQSISAQRAVFGFVSGHIHGPECHFGNTDICFATTAVDNAPGSNRFRTARPKQINYFARAAAGGHYVFNYNDFRARSNLKPPPERHSTCLIPLRENVRCVQSPRHFMTNYQSTHRGRNHKRRIELPDLLCQFTPENLGMARVLQHQRTLQEFGNMQTTRQPEMTLQVGSGASEQLHYVGRLRHDQALLYHQRFSKELCIDSSLPWQLSALRY